MMTKKKYFIWLLVILLALIVNTLVFSNSLALSLSKGSFAYIFFVLYILSNMLFGVALGFDYFLVQCELKHAKWHTNFNKLCMVVLPIFIICCLQFSPIILIRPFSYLYLGNPTLTTFIQILCGYSLITSFYRAD